MMFSPEACVEADSFDCGPCYFDAHILQELEDFRLNPLRSLLVHLTYERAIIRPSTRPPVASFMLRSPPRRAVGAR